MHSRLLGWPDMAGLAQMLLVTAVIVLPALSLAQEPPDEVTWDHRWRVEGGGAYCVTINDREDHGDDFYFPGSVEYLFNNSGRGTIGWRTYPLFIFRQQEQPGLSKRDETIYGVATGLALRLYADRRQKGLFGEIGSAVLWQSDEFYRNGSSINFLSEGGIGWRFANDWHIAVKYQHISNAGIERPNDGINAIALTVGFTF